MHLCSSDYWQLVSWLPFNREKGKSPCDMNGASQVAISCQIAGQSWLISCINRFLFCPHITDLMSVNWALFHKQVACRKIQFSHEVYTDTQVSLWQIVHICDVKSIDCRLYLDHNIFLNEEISCSMRQWLSFILSLLCAITVGGFHKG